MIKTNNVFLRYKALNRFINRANKNLYIVALILIFLNIHFIYLLVTLKKSTSTKR